MSGGLDDFIAYNPLIGNVSGNPTERIPPVKRQKTDYGFALPVMDPAIDVQWLPGTCRKKGLGGHGVYKRYFSAVIRDAGFPSEVPAEAVEGIADIFDQEALWETGSGSFILATNCSIIAAILQPL